MTRRENETIVVLGATGQQGGATATALIREGWKVRAPVRHPSSAKSKALAALGIEVVQGDYREPATLERALQGAYGAFSIQPSSGQPEYGVTDDDEVRFGTLFADAAKSAGVRHFVYTSVAGLRPNSGIGHFESKWTIEEHVRKSGLPATIVRPATFMELLLLPHFGLATGQLSFFVAPDRAMPFIAVEDIGVVVARIFADPERFIGQTLDIAAENLTGNDLARKISAALGRPVTYARFPAEVLEQQPLLKRIVAFVDELSAAGDAELSIRALHPSALTFDSWLEKTGRSAIEGLSR